MEIKNDAFATALTAAAEGPVHTNSHNHALVQNPFAWEDDAFATALSATRDASGPVHTNSHNHALVQNPFAWEA